MASSRFIMGFLLAILAFQPVVGQTYFTRDADTSDLKPGVLYGSIGWTKTLPLDKIETSKEMQAAYAEASSKKYGYRLLQLAALEVNSCFTFGKLDPNKIVIEAYNIAVTNKDAMLCYYLTIFNLEYNYSLSIIVVREMFLKSRELGLERKDVKALNLLANLEDSYNLMKGITPMEIRKQALFIDNKGYAPYPNPYDNPDTTKPLDKTPFIWNDFPKEIDTESEMDQAYNKARAANDGYRLLQLAKVEHGSNYSKSVTPDMLLKQAYSIATYNKDPYLLLYVCEVEKETKSLQQLEPGDIFRKAYNTAIERRDSKALSLLSTYEKLNNYLPEIRPIVIQEKAAEIDKLYRAPLR